MLEKIDKERLEFVRSWAKYVKETDPMIWPRQQKSLIDQVLKNANQDVELYLKVKEIAKKIRERLSQKKQSQ